MKKLRFIRFLYKKLIGAIIISAIICSVVCPLVNLFFDSMQFNLTNDIVDLTQISLLDSYIDYGMSEAVCKRVLTISANYGGGFDVAMAVVDKDNDMKLIATSEIATTLVLRGDTPRIFIAATDELEAVYERNEELDGWVVINEIYADGDYFYPGVVEIVDEDKYFSGAYTEEDVFERYDFTPENAEDYEHIKDDMYMNFYLGTPSDSRALKFLEEHYINRNMSYKDEEVYYNQLPFAIDGKNYRLYTACRYEFFAVGKYLPVVLTVGTFLIAIIIALITAYTQYKKYCTQYEIDEFRRTMTSALAHDLKTPLTAVMGYAENLRDNVHSEKREHYAEAVIDNVNYMNGIITSTLDLAKLDMHEGIKAVDTDITAIAQELISKYRANAEDRDIKFTVKGKCRIKADRELISRAVENLISNAVKYTSDGGEVKIIGSSKSFVIENTCDSTLKGGTDDFCKPFFKADDSRSNRSGSGMGLAAVRNITAMHGFKFRAEAHDGRFVSQIIFR